ncbi:MAG: hypothetical protein LBS00_12840 [Synergistaceae bacterium]|jgi:septal ring factor EnvC (AmiA/AmiB activator)|nr:hypothetical protein [Synergistaceae bacterium]
MPEGTAMLQVERKGSVSVQIIPVDEKRFEAENRRLDTEIGNAKKTQEKFETRTEKKIDELKEDIAQVRTELKQVRTELKEDIAQVRIELKQDISRLDAKFDDLRKEVGNRMWWLFGAVVLSILVPVALQYFGK